MPTVSTPVSAWVASILTSTGTNQSSSIYVTVNITAGWEVQLPVRVQQSNVSADQTVNIYALMDGTAGGNYDQTAFTSFSVARVSAGGTGQGSIRLSTGQYLVQMIASGPQSQSFAVLTQLVITSINNA